MQSTTHDTILVVNDLADQLQALTATLKGAGYDVLSTTNTNAAIKLATLQRPDLIISDLSNPSRDGAELHGRIRTSPQLAETPILVISALHIKSTNKQATHQLDDFLEFPYEPIELITRITKLIERKRIHDELKHSKARYIDLFENAADIVYTHDLQGHYTSLNKKGQELTGYTTDDITTIDFNYLADPSDVQIAKEMLRRKLDGDTTSTVYEVSIHAKDGSTIPVEVSTQLIFQNGKPVGVQGIARDISARKQAEEQLRQAAESLLQANRRAITEYKTLLDRIAKLGEALASARELKQIFFALLEFTTISLPCDALGIALYNHEEVELYPQFLWLDGEVIDVSKVKPIPVTANSDIRNAILSAQTLIASTNTIRNSQPLMFEHQDTRINVTSTMTVPMTIMGRTVGTLQIQSVTPDAYQPEHITAVQMAANLAANTIENVRLLNSEREHENQRRQSQKMEAIGQLAGGVVHDFNNIVTVIYGNCDIILREIEPQNPLHKHIDDIRQAGKRAEILTRQLLAVSRKQLLQPVNLDLNEVVQSFESFLIRLISEDIAIVSKLAADLPEIKADKVQLEQILMNLVINARDAMPEGGQITIQTSVVYPKRSHPQQHLKDKARPHVQLSVSDTGTGMSAEIQQQIFEPFFTTKEDGKGTGLGLSTCYGAVKQSGGSIWVESKEGQGATFKIQFPIAAEEHQHLSEQTTNELNENHHGTQTILIAEDDARVREVLRDALVHAGYQVKEAINGMDAWEVFQDNQNQIHLVLTDVLMPEMSGRQLAVRIHKINPNIPIIYMSGHTTDLITERGALIEGLTLITKPFKNDSVINKIQETLRLTTGHLQESTAA